MGVSGFVVSMLLCGIALFAGLHHWIGGAVVEEVRGQFRDKPGIMDGSVRPNYARTVDLVTRAAIRVMIIP
jgi:Na+/H+-translocating membrane pyrophosphatase